MGSLLIKTHKKMNSELLKIKTRINKLIENIELSQQSMYSYAEVIDFLEDINAGIKTDLDDTNHFIKLNPYYIENDNGIFKLLSNEHDNDILISNIRLFHEEIAASRIFDLSGDDFKEYNNTPLEAKSISNVRKSLFSRGIVGNNKFKQKQESYFRLFLPHDLLEDLEFPFQPHWIEKIICKKFDISFKDLYKKNEIGGPQILITNYLVRIKQIRPEEARNITGYISTQEMIVLHSEIMRKSVVENNYDSNSEYKNTGSKLSIRDKRLIDSIDIKNYSKIYFKLAEIEDKI